MAANKSAPSYLIPGFHNVDVALDRDDHGLERVYLLAGRKDKRIQALARKLQKLGVPVSYCNRQELDEQAPNLNHQGVVAVKRGAQRVSHDLQSVIQGVGEKSLLLVLDQVQDPHNLGACIRTAECAGADAIILPKDRACPVNATVRKVASGAAETLPVIYVSNLVNTLSRLQKEGFWVYGADERGVSMLHQCEFSNRSVIVMGAEGKGIRRLVLEACDFSVRIPMQGSVSSLNVSVATGLMLFEARRHL